MLKTQKLANSQWVAHDSTTSDVLPKTLRSGLLECKAAYIREYLLTEEDVTLLFLAYRTHEVKISDDEIISRFEDRIPSEIHFVIVTLNPRWETTQYEVFS